MHFVKKNFLFFAFFSLHLGSFSLSSLHLGGSISRFQGVVAKLTQTHLVTKMWQVRHSRFFAKSLRINKLDYSPRPLEKPTLRSVSGCNTTRCDGAEGGI